MDRLRYLELLDVDGRLLSTAAADDLRADVPACPGWTVGDVVRHTAEVYEHKIACIQLAGARPDPWPPRWPADRDPVTWFVEAHGRLLQVLASTDPAAAVLDVVATGPDGRLLGSADGSRDRGASSGRAKRVRRRHADRRRACR
jgi:hypothetical protein